MSKTSLKYGELFCGPGGLAYGALQAGKAHSIYKIEHAWASDIDENACMTYGENICGDPFEETVMPINVHDLNIKGLGPIDILAFGFPCNDFSLVGEQKGLDGIYGPLYSYGEKVLIEKKPKAFIAENVSGITSSNRGDAFKMILKKFIKAGYRITVNKFCFEKYSVPQSRHRIVIAGLREKDHDLYFQVPSPSNKIITCKQALEKPKIPADAENNELTTHPDHIKERLKHILPGQNAWTAKLPKHLQLNVKGAKLSQIYKRLNPKAPAYTVTGSGGGGTHIYHYDRRKNRALTNRERARLQTFPDDYYFHGKKESVRKQIGMAVPVKGAKIIFTALLNTLSGRSYKYTKPSVGYFDSGNIEEIDSIS